MVLICYAFLTTIRFNVLLFTEINSFSSPVTEIFCALVSEDYKLIFRYDSMVTIKRGIPTIDSFTFCLWIKKYNDTQGRLISLLNVDSEPSLSIFIGEKLQIAADGDIWERDVDSTLPRETWKHVCLVFDADESSKVTVFINGAQDGDISTDNLATFVASGRQIVLGDLKRSTDTGFTGEISHFHVWKAALSGTDINTVKNSCLFPSDVEKFKNNLLYKWSVDRTDIDTHESVSKIESDACGK